MKVLVVSKKTNLELHGETIRKRVQAGLIDPQYFHLLEKTHEEHYSTLKKLYHLLAQNHIEYSTIARGLFWPDLKKFSAVLTVGGDGTVLEASHHILDNRVLLVGIRSAQSSIGKLCHSHNENLEALVTALSKGTLNVLTVSRLQARISSTETASETLTEPVLNDFLFTNAGAAATSRYKITLGTESLEQRSSGVWISTPCGSTAAIRAAGATPLPLTSRKFLYLVRELYDIQPVSSNTLSQGTFSPENELFRIDNLNERSVLACDGMHGTVYLSFGDVITFLRGPDLNLACPDFYTPS